MGEFRIYSGDYIRMLISIWALDSAWYTRWDWFDVETKDFRWDE